MYHITAPAHHQMCIVSENLNEQIENIKALESSQYKPLNIAIVGEVKSGKSSLLNALLGKEISKVDVLEASTVP